MVQVIPKGTLVIIGGAEDKGKEDLEIARRNRDYKPQEILRVLLPEKASSHKRIEVITTASSVPVEVNKSYQKAFRALGYRNFGFINIGNHIDAHKPSFIERVKKAHAILFSGGDQYRLSTILGNTEVLEIIKKKFMKERGFIVAGTSAGAMAMPALMMFEGEQNEAILKGTVKISSGLGLFDTCIIDTHFAKRGRFGRLAQAVVMNPSCVGIGLGEDTALIITKGRMATCIGSGMVVIIDGQEVGHTNMPYVENDNPVCIEGLKVHVLCRENGFELEERKFVPSRKDLKEESKRRAAGNKGLSGKKAKTNAAKKPKVK